MLETWIKTNCYYCSETNWTTDKTPDGVEVEAICCHKCCKEFWIDTFFNDNPEDNNHINEAVIENGRATPSDKSVPYIKNKLVIRKALLTDCPQIFDIYDFDTNYIETSNVLNYNQQHFEDYITKYKNNAKLFAATLNEEIVGFALIFDMGIWGYLDVLCVKDNKRGMGIGVQLLEFIKDYSKSKWKVIETTVNAKDLQLNNFMEKHGYLEHHTSKYRYLFIEGTSLSTKESQSDSLLDSEEI